MRRVLVVGGAGYIGSHTAQALARAGFQPIVLDNLSTGHLASVRWGPFIYGDVGDVDVVRRALRHYRIDAVMHFAASAYVGESVSAPRQYFQNNVANTLALLDEMLDAGVPDIVFSSTCATYGVPAIIPIAEDHAQIPVNPYGDSKLFIERALHAYDHAYALKYVALRYFNAAGADPGGDVGEDHDPETHIIPLAIDAALGRRHAVTIFGTDYPTADGTAVRDYTHVSDLATAHVRALAYLARGGRSIALNLGTGRGYSVREVIAAVERVGGLPVPLHQADRRPGDPPALVADATRAGDVLGWHARFTNLDEIVRTAWNWRIRTVPETTSTRSWAEASHG